MERTKKSVVERITDIMNAMEELSEKKRRYLFTFAEMREHLAHSPNSTASKRLQRDLEKAVKLHLVVAFDQCPVCGTHFRKSGYYLKRWEKNEIKIRLPPAPEADYF